jgi:hypothetical protein
VLTIAIFITFNHTFRAKNPTTAGGLYFYRRGFGQIVKKGFRVEVSEHLTTPDYSSIIEVYKQCADAPAGQIRLY